MSFPPIPFDARDCSWATWSHRQPFDRQQSWNSSLASNLHLPLSLSWVGGVPQGTTPCQAAAGHQVSKQTGYTCVGRCWKAVFFLPGAETGAWGILTVPPFAHKHHIFAQGNILKIVLKTNLCDWAHGWPLELRCLATSEGAQAAFSGWGRRCLLTSGDSWEYRKAFAFVSTANVSFIACVLSGLNSEKGKALEDKAPRANFGTLLIR